MKIRFQADANIDPAIQRGLLRREPAVDFRAASGVIPDGATDLEVLRLAAAGGRVLVTADVRTMIPHLREFLREQESPGVLLIPSSRSIGTAIGGLLFAWMNWTPEDLSNRATWLPDGDRSR